MHRQKKFNNILKKIFSEIFSATNLLALCEDDDVSNFHSAMCQPVSSKNNFNNLSNLNPSSKNIFNVL
jgi:hypothetical protein